MGGTKQAGFGGAQASGLHREFASRSSTGTRSVRPRHASDDRGVFAHRKIVACHAQQRDHVAFLLEAGLNHAPHVFDQSDHADHRRRQNSAAFGFVVKRDVAGNDRRVKGATGFGHSVDDFRKRPHHFRPFRRSEIQTIRDRDRSRADADDVARGFGDDQFRAFARIRGAVAAVSVESTSPARGAFP